MKQEHVDLSVATACHNCISSFYWDIHFLFQLYLYHQQLKRENIVILNYIYYRLVIHFLFNIVFKFFLLKVDYESKPEYFQGLSFIYKIFHRRGI